MPKKRILELSGEETGYRKKIFSRIENLTNQTVRCTACFKNLLPNVLTGGEIYHHPQLFVLLCKDCSYFFGDGDFSVDEDGTDKYCRWCGQGGTLYCCSECTSAFCKACIKRNLKRSILKDIETDVWKCFLCNGKPLWDLRAICYAAEMHSLQRKRLKRGETIIKSKESKLEKLKKQNSTVKDHNELRKRKNVKKEENEVVNLDTESDEISNTADSNRQTKSEWGFIEETSPARIETDSDTCFLERGKSGKKNQQSKNKKLKHIVNDRVNSLERGHDLENLVIDLSEAEKFCKSVAEHLEDMISTGDIISLQCDKILKKKVNIENMGSFSGIKKVIEKVELVAQLSSKNLLEISEGMKNMYEKLIKKSKKYTKKCGTNTIVNIVHEAVPVGLPSKFHEEQNTIGNVITVRNQRLEVTEESENVFTTSSVNTKNIEPNVSVNRIDTLEYDMHKEILKTTQKPLTVIIECPKISKVSSSISDAEKIHQKETEVDDLERKADAATTVFPDFSSNDITVLTDITTETPADQNSCTVEKKLVNFNETNSSFNANINGPANVNNSFLQNSEAKSVDTNDYTMYHQFKKLDKLKGNNTTCIDPETREKSELMNGSVCKKYLTSEENASNNQSVACMNKKLDRISGSDTKVNIPANPKQCNETSFTLQSHRSKMLLLRNSSSSSVDSEYESPERVGKKRKIRKRNIFRDSSAKIISHQLTNSKWHKRERSFSSHLPSFGDSTKNGNCVQNALDSNLSSDVDFEDLARNSEKHELNEDTEILEGDRMSDISTESKKTFSASEGNGEEDKEERVLKRLLNVDSMDHMTGLKRTATASSFSKKYLKKRKKELETLLEIHEKLNESDSLSDSGSEIGISCNLRNEIRDTTGKSDDVKKKHNETVKLLLLRDSSDSADEDLEQVCESMNCNTNAVEESKKINKDGHHKQEEEKLEKRSKNDEQEGKVQMIVEDKLKQEKSTKVEDQNKNEEKEIQENENIMKIAESAVGECSQEKEMGCASSAPFLTTRQQNGSAGAETPAPAGLGLAAMAGGAADGLAHGAAAKLQEAGDFAKEKAAGVAGSVESKIVEVKDQVEEKVNQVKEKVENLIPSHKPEKIEDIAKNAETEMENIAEKGEGAMHNAITKTNDEMESTIENVIEDIESVTDTTNAELKRTADKVEDVIGNTGSKVDEVLHIPTAEDIDIVDEELRAVEQSGTSMDEAKEKMVHQTSLNESVSPTEETADKDDQTKNSTGGKENESGAV